MRLSKFTKKIQLQKVLGPMVYEAVQKMLKKDKFKRMPWSIEFHKVKPVFHLNDSCTMTAYALNLETGVLSDGQYCGSGISTIDHEGAQLSEGYATPKGYAVFFLQSHYNGGGPSAWTLDIVTDHLTPVLGTVQDLQLKVGL
jgi:hypothetical protein